MQHRKALNHAARIWAFDGGGSSVISQLLIIDEIMHQIQWHLKLEEIPRPCDYTELMVGTGLGALISILLARVRLTARQALDHTIKFGQRAFTESNEPTTGHKYNVDQLIMATRTMLSDCGLDEDARMIENVVTSGQTYAAVTAVPTSDLPACRLLRSYHHPGTSYDCSIIEAVLASMAIPKWFPPVTIGSGYSKEELIGGSLGFNNPAKKALEEAERIFGSEQQVSIVISFGTGEQVAHSLTDYTYEGLQQTVNAMAQDGGNVTDDLARRFHDSPFYYRFSLDCKESMAGMNAWTEKELTILHTHTKSYMERISSSLNSVAEVLVENKGSHSLEQITRVKTATVVAKAVPRISPYYVERDEIYDYMNRRLIYDDWEGQRLFVIHGMGGAGKTQLTSFFARKNCDRYKYTFFVDASSVESIQTDLQSAIRSLGGSHSQDTYVDAIRFLAHPDNRDWLVIFDNADDPKLPLPTYLPECDHGTVIITGRNHALAELALTSHWHLRGMDESDSIEVLFKAAKLEDSRTQEELKAADELHRLLGGLPLALVHVGSYCRTAMILLSQYLERFKTHRSELMAIKPPLQLDQYSYSTYASIGLSYSLLDERARSLLHLLTFFHPSSIRLDILRTASYYKFRVAEVWELLPPNDQYNDRLDALTELLMPEGSWSDVYIDSLLNQLQICSLISLSHSNGQKIITIHPLVQSCIRDRLSSVNSSLYLHMMVLVLSSCGREEQIVLCQHLPTHIAELETCKKEMHPNDLAGLAYIAYINGNYAEAMTKYAKVRDECRKMNGEAHRSTLWTSYSILQCLYDMHQYEEAETMIRDVVKAQERVLGEDDDDTVTSSQLLADILSKQQKTEEAESILKRLLTTIENKNGQEHPNTLRIQLSLAINLVNQRRYSEAEVMSRSILPIMKRVLGEDDTKFLNTLNILSSALTGQAKWAEAEDVLSEEIAKKTIIYGKYHLRTLISLYNFANCLIQREELDEAESILREVLEVREKKLKKDHEYTTSTRKNLEYVIRQKQIRHSNKLPPLPLSNPSPSDAPISDGSSSPRLNKTKVRLKRIRQVDLNLPIPKRPRLG